MAEVLGLLTARGGSKGVPRKNVRLLAGRPLVSWTVGAALKSRKLSRVVVSTEDDEIATICRQEGAEVPFRRPYRLAADESGHFDVVVHALDELRTSEGYEPDVLLVLQPTSPFRTSDDIDASLSHLLDDEDCDAVVGVTPVRKHPALMFTTSQSGHLTPLLPGELRQRRQEMPVVLQPNGAIFAIRIATLLREKSFYPERTAPYVMPADRSIDIDDEWDWRLAEFVASIQ